ncbi:MAG TPA: DUF1203 domain-containing protein [Acidisoma sp.]|uniref:DUF1203 domain-containing protein n=1 Tax=Acidisoma sp. TaxID=1872115 RepID=UPI002BF524DB|nr:DUF1203 domain-containing protein [Acidisoma sp.]HTI01608.1 DUF1203 domain-containing protein [Acidisoma sp.]
MTAFRCIAIPTEAADRFRQTGEDDNGNPLRRLEVTAPNVFPCRHCLNAGTMGEIMLLGSYQMPRPRGIYWTPSPIFVHERPCTRFTTENEIAPIVRVNDLISVRAYDAADQCIYDLGQVCGGAQIDAPLERALADPRTSFVNVHTARPGCFLSRVEAVLE